MKYVILSDIHANLQAFEAVEAAFSKKKYDAILCVGDTVGYGADPDACCAKISALTRVNVLGNHDGAAIGKTDFSNFNTHAAKAVVWTQEHIDEGTRRYLDGLPFVREGKDFTIAHGTLHEPEEFYYMMSGQDAMRTFDVLEKRICFVGHSHVPGTFILREGGLSFSNAAKVKLEEGAKYIVNAGSVGQPRDGDSRACYCVYDDEKGEVDFLRVEYDIMGAQESILKAGLPPFLAGRLEMGR